MLPRLREASWDVCKTLYKGGGGGEEEEEEEGREREILGRYDESILQFLRELNCRSLLK